MVRIVDGWLGALSSLERKAAERMMGGPVTAEQIGQEFGLPYYDAAALVRLLPALIYWRHYGGGEHAGNAVVATNRD